ncbi:MAG: hypothetical protein M1817_004389 [Caeruleum heppii]|nr:MAG: hypothetical protein M1817_004389 [Caeruleum heppii]
MVALLIRQATADEPKKWWLPPPPGITPGASDAPYIGQRIIVINAIFIPLVIIFTAARFYTRKVLTKSAGLDDWYLLIGVLFSFAQSIVTIIHTKYGLGYHGWDIPFDTYAPKYLELQFISILTFILASLFVKLSVLQLYLRIDAGKAYKITVWTLIVATVAYHIGSFLAHFTTCIPTAKSWRPMLEGRCFDKRKMALARAILNVINDVAILLVPLPILKGLQLPFRQKVALLAVLLTGSFVCIVTVIRLTHYIELAKTMDLSWLGVTTYLWCVVEVDVGIMCACMVTLRPLLRKILPSFMGTTSQRQSSRPRLGISARASANRDARDYTSYTEDAKAHESSILKCKNNLHQITITRDIRRVSEDDSMKHIRSDGMGRDDLDCD